jgi:hypothetical protein
MQNGFFRHIQYMKVFILILCAWLLQAGCTDSPVDTQYVLKLPEIPPEWETVLGKPQWQAEWLNADGVKKTAIIGGGGSIEISPPQTWASAVMALPYWPEKGIRPGVFKPAGAIFPFDVSGKNVTLSWQGGVDAVLFWELAAAAAADKTVSRAVDRHPQNFNWPRFRLLYDDPSVKAEFRADPWLADWGGIAEKIVQSGFDKRRHIKKKRSTLKVSAGSGPWIGTSPFAAPLFFEEAPVFPVRPAGDTWVSAEGLLRCNSEAWILRGWE